MSWNDGRKCVASFVWCHWFGTDKLVEVPHAHIHEYILKESEREREGEGSKTDT